MEFQKSLSEKIKPYTEEEDLLSSRGVSLEVLQDSDCIRIIESFISVPPEFWQ